MVCFGVVFATLLASGLQVSAWVRAVDAVRELRCVEFLGVTGPFTAESQTCGQVPIFKYNLYLKKDWYIGKKQFTAPLPLPLFDVSHLNVALRCSYGVPGGDTDFGGGLLQNSNHCLTPTSSYKSLRRLQERLGGGRRAFGALEGWRLDLDLIFSLELSAAQRKLACLQLLCRSEGKWEHFKNPFGVGKCRCGSWKPELCCFSLGCGRSVGQPAWKALGKPQQSEDPRPESIQRMQPASDKRFWG